MKKTFLSITLSHKRLVKQIIEKREPKKKKKEKREPLKLRGNNHPKQSQKTNYKLGNSIDSSYCKGPSTFIYEFLKN